MTDAKPDNKDKAPAKESAADDKKKADASSQSKKDAGKEDPKKEPPASTGTSTPEKQAEKKPDDGKAASAPPSKGDTKAAPKKTPESETKSPPKSAAGRPAPKPAPGKGRPPAGKGPAKKRPGAPRPAAKGAAPAAAQRPPAAAAPAAGAARPTRAVKPGEKQAGQGVAAADEKAVAARAAQGAIRPDIIRLPFFPPAVTKRPAPLIEEERRRQRIVREEHEARMAEWEELDPAQRVKRQHEWAEADARVYRAAADDEELEIYPINEPFSYVQIVRNKKRQDVLYHVIEPMLDRHERLLLEFIEETLVDVLDLDPAELDDTELGEYIEKKFDQVLYDYALVLTDGKEPQEGDEGYVAPSSRWDEAIDDEDSVLWTPRTRLEELARERLLYYIKRDFIGEGPLEVFMQDPMIEDISCDGPHVPVFIYHRKYESLTTTVKIDPHEKLDSFVIRLAQRAGKHVSIAEPILDATMRDGSRLQATLAKEVSAFGSTFTIRKFRDVPFTPIDLVRFGTMSSQILAYLWMVIQHGMSAMYAGGTASGKTTATNAVMLFIPPQLKVITIEDTREIQIPQPNWIAGVTRGGFGPHDEHGRQAGEIDMFQLLKNALRQRPEYVIVGEVRGAEAYNLFQAMATGHAAYGTMHADSVDAVIHRLESDPINIPRSLLEALDVVSVQMQTRVGGKRVRRTKQLTEVVGLDPNTREILTNEVFSWIPDSDSFRYSGISYVLERIAVETGRTIQQVKDDMNDRIEIIEWMIRQEILDYDLIGAIIGVFYRDRDQVMEHVKEDKPWRQ